MLCWHTNILSVCLSSSKNCTYFHDSRLHPVRPWCSQKISVCFFKRDDYTFFCKSFPKNLLSISILKLIHFLCYRICQNLELYQIVICTNMDLVICSFRLSIVFMYETYLWYIMDRKKYSNKFSESFKFHAMTTITAIFS